MDDIQRKLALIDKQLAGGFANSYKQIVSTCPLIFPAVGLIVGVLIQNTLFGVRVTGHGPRLFWLILLTLCAVSAVLLFVIQKRGRLGSYVLVPISSCALVCFICLGAIRLTSFHQPEPGDIRNLVTGERKLATIRGLIVTEPYINENRQWKFANFKPTDPASSFYLKVNEVETTAGWVNSTGTVRVQVYEPVLDLKAGDYIQAYCWLDRFSPPTNPGQFDIAKYLARKNVFIAASVESRDGVELLTSRRGGAFTRVKRKIRETATQALLGDLPIEDRSRGLLQALLLGYRGNIDSSTYRAFRKTGLLHFISLSGMHLGILVGIVWWLCKTAGLMKRGRAAVCIIAIVIFLLIVPPRAPTVRAAIICWVFCASFFFRRHSNPINTLSLAAIILLLIRPTQLFEAGWQLSFATVLGILLFMEKIQNFSHERTGNRFYNIAFGDKKILTHVMKKLAKGVITLFSVGFAAWLGGAGILLYHFYTITPLASIWTILVFPLVSAILTLGFLKIILFFLLPTLASILGVAVTLLADFLIWAVKLITHLDFSQVLIGHVPLTPVILYYGFILFAGFVYFRRPLIKKVVCTVMLLAITVFLGAAKWQRINRDELVVTCLDVGHGQAILAQLPGKANVLFDAGSLYKSDIGRRIITPFLDYIGINKIDAIIISHNDIDHINAIPEIAEYCKVNRVYANEAFFSGIDRRGAAKFLNDCLKENGYTVQPLGKDLDLGSTADIKTLWPNKAIYNYEQLSDNDKSLVSSIEFAGVKILLCSDIERFAQKELLRSNPNLKADVVVVPHHGSVRTAEPDFLENLDADILICSCGRTQYERLQTTKRKTKAKLFYTPKDGAIIVCISKDGTIRTTTFVKSQ